MYICIYTYMCVYIYMYARIRPFIFHKRLPYTWYPNVGGSSTSHRTLEASRFSGVKVVMRTALLFVGSAALTLDIQTSDFSRARGLTASNNRALEPEDLILEVLQMLRA